MPERPFPKLRPHPHTAADTAHPQAAKRTSAAPHQYAELQVTSNFTFLTGASHPEELVQQAAQLGLRAVALTDRHTLAGIVRAHVAARDIGMQLIVGTRLDLHRRDDTFLHPTPGDTCAMLVHVTSRKSYAGLCRLLTIGKRRAPKGQCWLTMHDLLEHNADLLITVIPPRDLDQRFMETVEGIRRHIPDDRLSIAATWCGSEDDRSRLMQLADLCTHTHVPLVATNDVHYHVRERQPLQDVLTCIRHGCTLDQAGFRLFANAERCLKPPDEMARLFADLPQAVRRTVELAVRASSFTLDELRYQYPEEVCPPGVTPLQHLRRLTMQGAARRYADTSSHSRAVPTSIQKQLEHEFELIAELDYAPYFLTVHDIVTFARSRGILCQGRGAAANSAVCYCLGITAVDPTRIDLLFERFISRERNEPPDIDIDFEHERREEVIQYIYDRYGRDRAALTAEVITYRGRLAVREVGKAFGLSLDAVDRLAKNVDWWSDQPTNADRMRELGLDPADPTVRRVMVLSRAILGFPRHLSQHVGGFVITRGPLSEMVPVENAAMPDRTVIEWDKDDIDAMGMLKVDCLGLGMLTCVNKAFGLLQQWRQRCHDDATRQRHDAMDADETLASLDHMIASSLAHPGSAVRPCLDLASVPAEDPTVYDMICAADTIGVFQIESRAQMTMLPRLRPRCFYDLVIEVAIVRPGPIQGDMVHPYLRRRDGRDPVTYPNADVERVLGKTLGVPLFQEQAMSLAMVAAGFTPGQADQLRRAMAAWKRKGDLIATFETKFINGMLERGYDRDFADRCFRQIRGFSEYGFPESHAASFALIVYVSAWLKRYHPAAFAAALINSQPMGFYAPAQIIRDAQDHGVAVRAVDVNASAWDCALEAPDSGDPLQPALRLGMRLVKGLRQEHADAIAAAVREAGPFDSIAALCRAGSVPAAALRKLANADAFQSMGLDRQSALWHIRTLRDEHLPLFDDVAPLRDARQAALPPVAPVKQVVYDYGSIGLSLKNHPMHFLRHELDARGVTPTHELKDESRWPQGRRITVAGMALCRQRPATAAGLVFMTLEDETGIANVIIRPKVFETWRSAARHGIILLVQGWVERLGDVVHVQANRLDSLDEHMAGLVARSRDFH